MMKQSEYTSDNSYSDILTFNAVAGNLYKSNTVENLLMRIRRQLDLVQEELRETYTATEGDANYAGILDGCCDLMVVITGLQQILEANEFDVKGALKATNENNLSKFCRTPPQVYDTMDFYAHSGIECIAIQDDISGLTAIKNKDTGKVLKRFGFKSNDVSSFIPKTNKDKF